MYNKNIKLQDNLKIFNRYLNLPYLEKTEEIDLFLEYRRTGDLKIREKILNHNFKLIVQLAFKLKVANLPEAVSRGAFGLMQAFDSFKTDRGVIFRSYASHRIIGQIKRFDGFKEDLIHIPTNIKNELKNLTGKVEDLEKYYGDQLTSDEQARLLTGTCKKLKKLEKYKILFPVNHLSLDELRADKDNREHESYYESIPDPKSKSQKNYT